MPKITTQTASSTVITAAGNTATATVQPVGNVGGPVVVHIGVDVVSGTSPTWAPVAQFSNDGTTWLASSADETIPGGTTPSFTATIAIWS